MVVIRRVLARYIVRTILVASFGILFIYGFRPWLPFHRWEAKPKTLVFYGFSILEGVMKHEIFPAFQELWFLQTGERLEIISSFSGSGTITNLLLMGVPAEMALLSNELDAQRLSESRLITDQSWHQLPYRGVLNCTPIVLLVRPGNPLGIHDFVDLIRPGVKIIHPDPLTSGSSNWAIMAEYGSMLNLPPGESTAAYDLLLGIWRNVVARTTSARAARTLFDNGFGDVLVTYEQDVLYDKVHGTLHGEIVYPRRSILCEHPLVVIDKNVAPEQRSLVDTFVSFLWSEQSQRIFMRYGYRSINECLNEESSDLGNISALFRIEDFGGWRKAKADIIDGIWKDQVLKAIAR